MGQADLVEQAYPTIRDAVKPITVSKQVTR